MKFKCCAICGSTSFWGYDDECHECGNKRDLPISQQKSYQKTEPIYYYSRHDIEYYENIAMYKYQNSEKWYDVFVEEELSHISTFNKDKYQTSKAKEESYYETQRLRGNSDISRKAYLMRMQNPEKKIVNKTHTPKCPTCGSTNIKKLSDIKKATHALTFGLFSATARSQFECLNCHYKW